jgi:hypothetical protein
MRAYALVLGAVVTAGSAYVANMAVSSAGVMNPHALYPQCRLAPADFISPTAVWYGGSLDPITITAPRVRGPILMTGKRSPADTSAVRMTM